MTPAKLPGMSRLGSVVASLSLVVGMMAMAGVIAIVAQLN